MGSSLPVTLKPLHRNLHETVKLRVARFGFASGPDGDPEHGPSWGLLLEDDRP